eukprot:g51820.t1
MLLSEHILTGDSRQRTIDAKNVLRISFLRSKSSGLPSATRVELLGLYRQLLRHAKRYPSVKRDGLYQTIRLEWRENAKLSDVKSREFQIRSATFGLHKLKEMTDLDPNATAWTVNMDPQK